MVDWLIYFLIGLAIGVLIGYPLGKWLARRHFRPTIQPMEDDADPRAIDPHNPPRYTLYRPGTYNAEHAPHCSCHDRTIREGEKVLLWPIPNHPEGAVDIFCEDTYGQVSP